MPRASIVMLTRDNLVFNRLAIESVLAFTEPQSFELIVVDNGSTDHTCEYLVQLADYDPHIRLISNDDNRGFAAGNNQGLADALGDVLVLLNNDTIVTPGWLGRLLAHLEDSEVGLVGAVTNRAGNEAEIDVSYRTFGEMLAFAEHYASDHAAQHFDIRTATMFCAALRREVFEHVGPLDEQFQVGLFEDDDYSMRVRQAGWRVVCAEDTFIHHFGQASIGKLAASGQYGELFHANRRRWEAKWGRTWQPYERRQKAEYQHLLRHIQAVAKQALPRECTVAVISKGDDSLLELGECNGRHFPCEADGTYSGYCPKDGDEALRLLYSAIAEGAQYLLIPATAMWWLDYYGSFGAHLQSYPNLVDDAITCRIVTLNGV